MEKKESGDMFDLKMRENKFLIVLRLIQGKKRGFDGLLCYFGFIISYKINKNKMNSKRYFASLLS